MDTTKTVSNSLRFGIAALGEAGNRALREAIRNNLVTFPAQVPTFKKVTRPDLQAKIAILYFVRSWSMSEIGDRYNLARQRVGQIITQWRIRAVAEGYIQVIRGSDPRPRADIRNRSAQDEMTGRQISRATAISSQEYPVNEIPNDREAFAVEPGTPAEDLIAAIRNGMLLDFSGYYGLAFAWKNGQAYRGALLHEQKLREDHIFETAKEAIEWLQEVIARLDWKR